MEFNGDLDKLYKKVARERSDGENSIRTARDYKRNQLDKVFPDPTEKKLKVGLIYRNIQLENSLFLTDETNIDLVTDDGVIGKEMVSNIKKVFKYDDESMNLYNLREDIINYNGIYGVAITVVDGYDKEDNQPVSFSIDPLCVVPDSKNWRGDEMRYFGIERLVRKEDLESNDIYFNIDKIVDGTVTSEQKQNEQAYSDIGNVNDIYDYEGLVSIYDHFTTFDGKKVLTTWANGGALLIRYVEIEPLTEKEKLKNNCVKFPIQIHRRKPKINSFFGVSIVDEVAQYQDNVTKLMNLQMIQARIASLGPDKFVDQNLGIDVSLLGEKLPGGRVLPVNANGNIGNSIYNDVYPNPSQFPNQIRGDLEAYSQKTTGVSDMSFGTSLPGNQTKAEVQMLQSNANTILRYIGNNYLRGQKEYWTAHYRQYVLNMKGKKQISLFDNGSPVSMTLRRKDFVSEGKVVIYLTSANEKRIQDEKDVAKLISIANLYLPNMKPGYGMNEFLRKIGDSLGVQNFEGTKYIVETPDEMRAKMYLEGLNNNEEAPAPRPGEEDLMTYIQIYKQALDTPAKFKAMLLYTQAYQTYGGDKQVQEVGTGDPTTGAMAMNNIVSNQNSIPNLGEGN